MFQQVYKSNEVPSRLEFVEAWPSLMSAVAMSPTPARDAVIDIYDVRTGQKAATVFPSGRVSFRTEYASVAN